MKNQQYRFIFEQLLQGLEYEEKIREHQKLLILRIIDDLMYDKSYSDYTIRQFEDIIEEYNNKDT